MESWSRVIFCRDLRLWEPWEHSHVFMLESVLPSREESWFCASGSSSFPSLLIIFSRDLIFNRDQYCGALPLGKRENKPEAAAFGAAAATSWHPLLQAEFQLGAGNAEVVSHQILLERGTKKGQAGDTFPTLTVFSSLSDCME